MDQNQSTFSLEQRIVFEHELETRDFGTMIDTLAGVGLTKGSRPSRLVNIGSNIVELDAAEFEEDSKYPGLPASVKTQLRLCGWPKNVPFKNSPPFNELVPTYELLLELLEVHVKRRNWTEVLAITHLASEYMPFLAAQSILGHAGRPEEMVDLLHKKCLDKDGPHADDCKLSKMGRSFASGLRVPENAQQLEKYLVRNHSRVAGLVLECPRLVADSEADLEVLAPRFHLISKLQSSSLLKLRHGSPVGHFFEVPSGKQIQEHWTAYAKRRKEGGGIGAKISEEIPAGPADLVTAVAGSSQEIRPSKILEPLAQEIRRSVETALD